MKFIILLICLASFLNSNSQSLVSTSRINCGFEIISSFKKIDILSRNCNDTNHIALVKMSLLHDEQINVKMQKKGENAQEFIYIRSDTSDLGKVFSELPDQVINKVDKAIVYSFANSSNKKVIKVFLFKEKRFRKFVRKCASSTNAIVGGHGSSLIQDFDFKRYSSEHIFFIEKNEILLLIE